MFLAAAFAYAPSMNLCVLHRWLERPEVLALQSIGTLACLGLVHLLRPRIDELSFLMAATIFAAAFTALAASFLPYMVPFEITVAQAAAPPANLAFLFWGVGLSVLPVILIYALGVHRVFEAEIELTQNYGYRRAREPTTRSVRPDALPWSAP